MKRDINKVQSYVMNKLVPGSEVSVRRAPKEFYVSTFYRAPETQDSQLWIRYCNVLTSILGDPTGCEWKEAIARVVNDEEKIPEDFHELSLPLPD